MGKTKFFGDRMDKETSENLKLKKCLNEYRGGRYRLTRLQGTVG